MRSVIGAVALDFIYLLHLFSAFIHYQLTVFYFPVLFGSTIVLSVLLRTINKCVLGLPSALWITPVDGSSYGPQDLTRSTSVS